MAVSMDTLVNAAREAFEVERQELAAAESRQLLAVLPRRAAGAGDLLATFQLDRDFRLVYLRCHFIGTAGWNRMYLEVASAAGSAHDTVLYEITRAGPGNDVNFRVPAEESADPSPWAFAGGDAFRVRWTSPDGGNIAWGIEVGLVPAS